jgi:predicted DNA-binding transcriptional regulator AlpA
MTEPMSPLISHAAAARLLGISKKTLYQMNWTKTGPRSYRVGKFRKYDVADIKTWLAGRASA